MHGCPGAGARCLYGSHGASLGCRGASLGCPGAGARWLYGSHDWELEDDDEVSD